MLGESRFDKRDCECRGLIGNNIRRLAQWVQCRADRTLSFAKSLPDPVGRRITQPAVETTERLELIARGYRLFQKCPQARCGQKQAPDLVRPPDPEGSSTAVHSAAVATEDPLCTDRFSMWMLLVVTAQIPVADEVTHTLAMWASRQLQLGQNRIEFLTRLADKHEHDSLRKRPHLGKGSDSRELRDAIVEKIGGGVRCLRQVERGLRDKASLRRAKGGGPQAGSGPKAAG